MEKDTTHDIDMGYTILKTMDVHARVCVCVVVWFIQVPFPWHVGEVSHN